MPERMTLIEQILEIELGMFKAVPTSGENRCRENPAAFKLHRQAQFSIFSTATLASYFADLRQALTGGINLMTNKYARMDRLISTYNQSPLVPEIAGIMVTWQFELMQKYPRLKQNARPLKSSSDESDAEATGLTSFETYLRAELETYSERTLALLINDLRRLGAEGKNGSEEIYRNLIRAANHAATQT